MLLDISLGVVLGVFFLRAGLPSIFPLLLWLSTGNAFLGVWGIIGLASAGIVHGFKQNEFSAREDILIGFSAAIIGLFFLEYFFQRNYFDGIIFPILFLSILFWFIFLFHFRPRDVFGGIVMLFAGWWLLHERVIPGVLPAFFLGWWGLSWFHPSMYGRHSRMKKIRDAGLGCISGLLPGVGPGLINAGWMSGHASLSMGISNLVFSIGLAAQQGSIRSAIAAQLGDVSFIPWLGLVVVLGWGVLFSFLVFEWLPPHFFSFPDFAWVIFNVAAVFGVGGVMGCAVILFSYSLRRFLGMWDISPGTGMLILVPSILWFYHPF